MEEEEHTDRKQQLAMLYQKLNKIKKYLNEGNGLFSSPVIVRSIYISLHMSILHNTLHLLQMTRTILTRLSAQTHLNHASPI